MLKADYGIMLYQKQMHNMPRIDIIWREKEAQQDLEKEKRKSMGIQDMV